MHENDINQMDCNNPKIINVKLKKSIKYYSYHHSSKFLR